MGKSILVMDTPENCAECAFSEYQGIVCRAMGLNKSHSNPDKPDWCPLRDIPEHKEVIDDPYSVGNPYDYGWNACISKILNGGQRNE